MGTYYLAYDPASYSAGAALFCSDRGLIAWKAIIGKKDQSLPQRLRDQYAQLSAFVGQHVNVWEYVVVLVENVCAIPSQQMVLAASATIPLLLPQVNYYTLIQISSWKAWLVTQGVPKERCKGRPALSQIRPELPLVDMTDDVADAIIFGLYYLDKRQGANGKSIQTTRRNRPTAKKSPRANPKLAAR